MPKNSLPVSDNKDTEDISDVKDMSAPDGDEEGFVVEPIPDTLSKIFPAGFLPGFPSDSRHIKKALHRIGVTSDARRKSEIVRVNSQDGSETYDFPSRIDRQSVTSRVKIHRSRDLTIGASIVARNAIRCTDIFTDTNPNAKGMWIRVTYSDMSGRTREILDRIEAFTVGDITAGPWAEMQTYSVVTERDVRALREYLSTHIASCVSNGEVRILDGTSYIGWGSDFKSYSRPGFMDAGVRGLYADSAASAWTANGDAESQRRILLNLFAESPRALMVAGFATAGMLLRPVGIGENYILALVGPDSSSLGKSTLQRVIKSLFARPDRLNTFDSTTKALKSSTLYANDSVALIEEIGAGKLDQKERDALVYGLSMGVPREYLVKVNGEWQPRSERAPARYTVVLSGEESLIEQSKAKKGVKIRYTQIAVSSQARLWGFNDNERIESAMESLNQHHGHIFPAIIEMIQSSPEYVPTMRAVYAAQLQKARESCGRSEKAKRKAHQVALAQLGILVLQQVLDPSPEHDSLFESALDAAHELIDDFIQQENSSDLLGALLSIPGTLAPFFATETEDGLGKRSTIPSRMIGSAFHGSIRYQQKSVKSIRGDAVPSITDKVTDTEIRGTVITLLKEVAGPVVQEKLGVDLAALVDEAIRMGWAKLRPSDKGGYRKSVMCKFIISENGRTRTQTGYEFIIPDDFEAPEGDVSDDPTDLH